MELLGIKLTEVNFYYLDMPVVKLLVADAEDFAWALGRMYKEIDEYLDQDIKFKRSWGNAD